MRFWITFSALVISDSLHPDAELPLRIVIVGVIIMMGGLVIDALELSKKI